MKRIALSAAVLVAIVAGAIVATGASSGSSGSPYQIRAIFDDASFAVPGEEVRIAGAPVGTIGSTEVTDRSGLGAPSSCSTPGSGCKAAVTFTVSKAGFTPFHANAFCAIRPQSLLGEKYIDCKPGTAATPALRRIQSGPGEGAYLLPLVHTSSPVDTDLVNDIYREPTRQQLSLILNELGTGLAARGSDLNEVIRRGNPALQYTDQVLKILANQHRELAQLAKDSNAVLTPLARDRQQISSFVTHANTTSVASATQATAEAEGIRLLPRFLRQLQPLMVDLGNLADQGTPLFNSLAKSGPSVARQYENLVPFASEARKALIALGQSSAEQQPLLLKTFPFANRVLRLGKAALPSGKLLEQLLTSLDQTGGIDDLMRVLFFGTSATNGFDQGGHFIRTEALAGACTSYSKVSVPGCSANFGQASAADVAASVVNDVAKAGGPRSVATAANGTRQKPGHAASAVASRRTSGGAGLAPSALTPLLKYLIGGSQ